MAGSSGMSDEAQGALMCFVVPVLDSGRRIRWRARPGSGNEGSQVKLCFKGGGDVPVYAEFTGTGGKRSEKPLEGFCQVINQDEKQTGLMTRGSATGRGTGNRIIGSFSFELVNWVRKGRK